MIPQGSPRVSLEGFTVRAMPRDSELGRAPQVQVHLSKRHYPCEGVDPFSPLRLPEHVEILLRDIDSSLVHRASGHLDVVLRAGTHRFPLAGRHHFLVEVSPGTKSYARLQLGETPAPLAEPAVLARVLGPGPGDATTRESRRVVRALELTFSPPLLLPNVIPTLLEVQELIRDHGIAGWVKSPVLGGTARVAQTVGSERFSELVDLLTSSANRLGFVLLRHVRAEPVFRPRLGIWELRLGFSGHVQLAGGVPLIPFTDVVLPAAVLPVPFASLDDLLSDNPLASADLRAERVRVDEAIEGIRGMFERARGTFTLCANVPKLQLHAEMVDRTELRMSAALPSQVTVSGRVSAQLSGDTLIADAERVEIGFPDATVHVGLRVLVEDLGPEAGGWKSRLRAHLENTVEPGSVIPQVDVEVTTRHPQATGDSTLALSLRNLLIDGGSGGMSIAGPSIDLWPMSQRVGFKCEVSTRHDLVVREAGLRSEVHVPRGSIGGALELGLDGLWHLDVEGQAGVALRVVKSVPSIPELSIDEGELEARIEGDVQVRAAADASFDVTNAFDVELREGRLETQLGVAELRLHDRRVAFPPQMRVVASSRTAAISASGIGNLAFDIAWDMLGQPTLLHAGD
ncbi:MAG: hypothetical protein MUF54_17825, partial [Polyangiaceae bacterium]|nr:hypothetical protein [Polyangiaceae bacterium]